MTFVGGRSALAMMSGGVDAEYRRNMPNMPGHARVLIGRLTRDDLVDLTLALLMALAATLETLSGNFDQRSKGSVVVTGLLVTLPLALRRRFPFATFLTVLVIVTSEAAVLGSNEGVGVLFGLLVGIYSVAAHTPLRTAVVGLLLTVPVMAFSNWRSTGHAFEDLEFSIVLLGGFWVAGRVVWSREQLVRQLAAQSDELRRGRAAESRALVAEERGRIARDVHDIVAHSVSVMVVQAEAGEALLPDSGHSGAAFRAIQKAGRSTLTELRNLLGGLGDDESSTAAPALAPQVLSPRLREANRLVDQLDGTGFDVTLRIEGDVNQLPAGVDLAAFRVLQEALTNALRHSRGTCVSAEVCVSGEEVVVDVLDDGSMRVAAGHGPMTDGTGRGLIGMRERVKLYGGEVESGPTDHGFRVHARIPIQAPDLGLGTK
jgi:signal transduction histidine kinase